MRPPTFSSDDDYGQAGLIGCATTHTNVYDGLTDQEAEQLKKELVEQERRRVPLGFYTHERRTS